MHLGGAARSLASWTKESSAGHSRADRRLLVSNAGLGLPLGARSSPRPYYGDKLDALVRYMALQTRRVAWMGEFLRTGEDRPVRYIRPAAPDENPQAHSEPA